MTTRTLSTLVAAILAAAAPLLASANTYEKAHDACAQAFIQSITATHGPAAHYRVVKPTGTPSSLSSHGSYYSKNVEFTLFATNVKTGATFASAACTAKPSGEIVALKLLPGNAAMTKDLRLSASESK